MNSAAGFEGDALRRARRVAARGRARAGCTGADVFSSRLWADIRLAAVWAACRLGRMVAEASRGACGSIDRNVPAGRVALAVVWVLLNQHHTWATARSPPAGTTERAVATLQFHQESLHFLVVRGIIIDHIVGGQPWNPTHPATVFIANLALDLHRYTMPLLTPWPAASLPRFGRAENDR